MLILALDTSTDTLSAGLVRFDQATPDPPAVLTEATRPSARRHGELLMPTVLSLCEATGLPLVELDAIVCGTGPGPFTGLRVGLVSAASMGDALGVPVYGANSLDAIAAPLTGESGLLVLADARRRELYWAAYDGASARLAGPAVATPAALAELVPGLGVARVSGPIARDYARALGLSAERAGRGPDSAGLVTVAAAALRAGRPPAPPRPCYLRRPDAQVPGERKRVSQSTAPL